MVKQNNKNTKWYVTTGVLLIIIVVMAVIMGWKIKSLNDDLNMSKMETTRLQGQVTNLETELASTKTQLTQAKSNGSKLENELTAANTQIEQLQKTAAATQVTLNTQADLIKTMKYPRHFNNLIELTNWLQKDDTNIKYKGLSNSQISFILQIRAAREGYLLPVRLPIGGSLDYITNMAIIGDSAYSVRGTDDFVEKWINISPVMPSYPITPESEQ